MTGAIPPKIESQLARSRREALANLLLFGATCLVLKLAVAVPLTRCHVIFSAGQRLGSLTYDADVVVPWSVTAVITLVTYCSWPPPGNDPKEFAAKLICSALWFGWGFIATCMGTTEAGSEPLLNFAAWGLFPVVTILCKVYSKHYIDKWLTTASPR